MRHAHIASERSLLGTIRLDAQHGHDAYGETKPKRRNGNPGTPKTGDKRVTNGLGIWHASLGLETANKRL
jgi:hypothetical protein